MWARSLCNMPVQALMYRLEPDDMILNWKRHCERSDAARVTP